MSFPYRAAPLVPILEKEGCIMTHRRFTNIIALPVLLAVFAVPVSASTVSVLMVETGLNEEIPSTRYSSLWEGGLMETFFNAGHIVTNCPIARMEKKPAQDFTGMLRADFNDAASGGVDYLILGFLNHQVLEGAVAPTDITIKIYRMDLEELVFERNFPAGTGKDLNEEYEFAQHAGQIIISQIKER